MHYNKIIHFDNFFFELISGDHTCYKCGEVGHMAKECSSSGGRLSTVVLRDKGG